MELHTSDIILIINELSAQPYVHVDIVYIVYMYIYSTYSELAAPAFYMLIHWCNNYIFKSMVCLHHLVHVDVLTFSYNV